MFQKIKNRIYIRDANKRSLVKRADFLFTIGLLLIVIGTDYALNGWQLIDAAGVLPAAEVHRNLVTGVANTIGFFTLGVSLSKTTNLTAPAFGLAAVPFALAMSLYALAAVIDTSLQAGFRAVLIFVLLRLIWLSAAVVDLPDRKDGGAECQKP
ncbi:hypothetical protein [Canibacter oris]|uniref:Uncharacterized protein n=1 Tax=Canibacter oris TaxID=1365628 RepID=A0A840DIP3_9MICO|nr:hypothetical protein [Canibacter oris]MBB4071635.1 hypothetical protein [Canibacter oris]